jgi:hypothetical protein
MLKLSVVLANNMSLLFALPILYLAMESRRKKTPDRRQALTLSLAL